MTHAEARFTREMWRLLPEGLRVALIDGTLVREPSPTFRHQVVLSRIQAALVPLVGPDRVVQAPMDVHLDEANILQPDLLVVPEGARPDPEAREAPVPLIVVEVLSASTADRDREVKTPLYLRAGVEEVWLVDLEARAVEIRSSEEARLLPAGETAVSRALPGFRLSPGRLFL